MGRPLEPNSVTTLVSCQWRNIFEPSPSVLSKVCDTDDVVCVFVVTCWNEEVLLLSDADMLAEIGPQLAPVLAPTEAAMVDWFALEVVSSIPVVVV